MGLSPPTWVLGGIGAAGLAMGTVFAFEVAAKNKDADSNCPSGHGCSSSDIEQYNRAIDDAKTARWLSIAGFSVGGAALVGGALLWSTLDRNKAANSGVVSAIMFFPHPGGSYTAVSGNW